MGSAVRRREGRRYQRRFDGSGVLRLRTDGKHDQCVWEHEAFVDGGVAVDRKVDAQEALAVLALACKPVAQQRVEDLGRGARVCRWGRKIQAVVTTRDMSA